MSHQPEVDSKRIALVESSGYRPGATAMTRSTPSSLGRFIKDIHAISPYDRVLHVGAGKPNNPDRALLDSMSNDVTHYEPDQPADSDTRSLRRHDFDVVVSAFVLNVLIPDHRREALKDIAESLAPGGRAYISVRGSTDVLPINEKNHRKLGWTVYKDGWLTPNVRGLTFQRGFTTDQLVEVMRPYFKSVRVLVKSSQAPIVEGVQ